MFGTKLHPITFVFIIVQIVCLIILSFFFLNRSEKKNFDLKFFTISTLCLVYNFSNGLIPDSNFIADIRSQYYITFAIGIIASCYSFYFIHTEHGLKIFNQSFVKAIILGFGVWYIVAFVSLYSITNNLSLCRLIFFVYPIGIAFYWFFKFSKWLIKSKYREWNKYKKTKVFTGLIGMISLLSFPVILIIFEDNQPAERIAYNIGYLSFSFFFFFRLNYKNSDNKTLEYYLNTDLTKRQQQILLVIYENPNIPYTELAKKLNISTSTFTTHTANIYKALRLEDKTKNGLLSYIDDMYNNI
ncbi:winged helix-turn-helix DNA-binding protein [Tenacibaculum caenipelagi]|uniref:Winged helix-turn-helix DNA-binding protein n=2 Tax=Tenacibaculum caenipelagi TaxID=1325435 RepID=A0A4R6TBA5_9FLAO|nr:winged helix-turn-helix DNA-binding protein [Tenacibaculum caenipelagi]